MLLVLRHAKSSWNDSTVADHERPLNERGRHDAPRVGELLRKHRQTPELIVSSDAVRARLTAEAVAKAARYDGEILVDPRLYLASAADILEVLRDVGDTEAETVMVVGHNPGLEELVEHLTGDPQTLPTAALARIALPIARWRDLEQSTRGKLLSLWRPKEHPRA